jgi:poly-beta-1,6-N-acetyl-D-glucosamine biosynthesis protein PgaD
MVRHNKIIYYPKKIPHYQRQLESFLRTSLSGLGLISLVLTALLWLCYGNFILSNVFSQEYLDDTLDVFKILLVMAVLFFAIILAWQQYNLRVFGQRERRKFLPPVKDSVLCGIYGFNAKSLTALRKAQFVVFQPGEAANSVWQLPGGNFHGEEHFGVRAQSKGVSSDK